MKLVLYIDVYFLINGIFDFCILLLVGKLQKCRQKLLRLLAGAAAGGLGATIILIFSVLPLSLIAVLQYGLLPVLMLLISFGFSGRRCFFHQLLSFYGIACLLGGILVSLGQENQKGMALAVAAGITTLILKQLLPLLQKRNQELQNEYEVAVSFGKGWVHGKALLDTGNRLREPFSGRPVVLAELEALKEIFPEELKKVFEGDVLKKTEIEAREGMSGFRFIPYRAVGTDWGLIPGIEVPQMKIWTERKSFTKEGVMLGIVTEPLAAHGEYQFILHEDIMC